MPTGSSMACFGIHRIDRIILSKDIPWSRNPTDRTYAPTDLTSFLFIVVMVDAIMNDGIKVKWKIKSTLQSFCEREPSSFVVLFWKFQTLQCSMHRNRWAKCQQSKWILTENSFVFSTTSHYRAIDVLNFGGYSGRYWALDGTQAHAQRIVPYINVRVTRYKPILVLHSRDV